MRSVDEYFNRSLIIFSISSISKFSGIQGHPTRNFDEISVRENLLVLRLSDNALTKSD